MAKKATVTTVKTVVDVNAQDAQGKFTAEAQRAYVEAVIRKQAGKTEAEAAAIADKLLPEELAMLHDAGRDGQVAVCREILGLA